jgi:hypothetical protein
MKPGFVSGMMWSIVLSASLLSAQEPTPARVGLTARCYYPGTIVLTWHADEAVGATVLRRLDDGNEEELARIEAGVRHYYDVGVAAGQVLTYRVRLDDGAELGPVPVANSSEMLIGGDLEGEALGPATATLAFHRAYGEPWWEVVEEARPGSPGSRSVRIRAGKPPRRDGLHSRLLPVDPRATYRQSGWARVLPDSNARLGRQLLTADLKPAGGRIVPYSYAPVFLEEDGGWQHFEQQLDGLPEDTAYIQVWALAFETRNAVWYDDLSLVDERAERLAAFDSQATLTELEGLALAPEHREQAAELRREVDRLETALGSPREMAVPEYLNLVAELDALVQGISDLTWDLKILSLAE